MKTIISFIAECCVLTLLMCGYRNVSLRDSYAHSKEPVNSFCLPVEASLVIIRTGAQFGVMM
jgi:hypothetical protein